MDTANLQNIEQTKDLDHPDFVPMIWVGYIKNGQHYVDMQSKRPDAETQLQFLFSFYEEHFSGKDRFLLRWIKCQKPVVKVGEIKTVIAPLGVSQRRDY